MAGSCRLSPSVFRRNGKKIEEKDSKLFKDIKKAVKDYNTAWEMWAYTKTPEFKDEYKNSVEYDELGEVTFPSLIKALGLEDVYNSQKSAEETARDYGFVGKTYDNAGEAVGEINKFNSKEDKHVASLHKTDDGYQIRVLPKSGQNVDVARTQSYNYALTGEIIKLMQSLGFNVEWVNDTRYDGLFDPENATLRDGLMTIIRIARGERGENALPEEFSHLMIEGLINHPLVQRLISTLDSEQVQEILGNNYEEYVNLYNNDELRLRKEAAGKLLAQYITDRGTISQNTIQPKQSLLSRIWNWIKNLFSKVKNEDIVQARLNAHEAIADVYNLISSDDIGTLVDKSNILNSDDLYKLTEAFNSLEKVAFKGEEIAARMLKNHRNKGDFEKAKHSAEILQKMRDTFGLDEDNMEVGDPYAAILTFLNDARKQIELINKDMRRADNIEKSAQSGKIELTDIQVINEIAKVAREIDTFIMGYKDIMSAISTFDTEDNIIELGLANKESGQALANVADACLKNLTRLESWRHATSQNILMYASRTVYKQDKVRGIGSKRDEVMSLTEILDHADRDINFIDRWFSAMSDADDALLTIFDSIVKNQQYERDMEMIEWNARIAAIDKKLRDAGYSSDFMYERDKDGVPTGRIISDYDWDAYNEDFAKIKALKREEQEKLGEDNAWYRKEIKSWKNGIDPKTNSYRLIHFFIDPEIEAYNQEHGYTKTLEKFPAAVYEMMPNPKVYSKNAGKIERLAPAQREYYNEMMKIKIEMMNKIPHKGQGVYRAVNISKDMIEGILSNSTGNPLKATLENYRKKFLRRPDDIGFGTGENYKDDIKNILSEEKDSEKAAEKIITYLSDAVDEDIAVVIKPKRLKSIIDRNKDDIKKATSEILDAIESENFAIVDTDFANHRIQRLPIYYTRPLKDNKMLSTDFSGTMVAYSAMAVNFEKMNQVVDILEIGRSYVKERKVLEKEGQNSVMSRTKALGKIYKAYVERAGNGTNISNRMDDYMDSVIYEERKEDEGSIDILGVDLDVAKTLDTIKDYTGLLGLGFNIFSTFSNIAVGKLQQWIEAYGGEYFTVKDYVKAVGQYSSLIGGCVAEMASPVKKNKLSLLIQMFDPMGDYYENLRDPNFEKNAVSRILGNGVLAYIGMNAGEHLLHCQTMLAILNNIKLTNTKTKEKISLYDALKVKEINGIYKLVLDDDLAYERELIDSTGNPKTNKNFGKPVRDENGKIKTEWVQLKDPGSIKDAINKRYKENRKKINEKLHGTIDPDEHTPEKMYKEAYDNFFSFIKKKKKIVRKVNDSLNGAFGVNDKGALHKIALGRLIMQFRQWMPAHYMRRFARAHYDADLEQWREGYYVTVGKTLNQMRKEAKKSRLKALKYKDMLSEHEKANLRRAEAEITEFLMLLALVRLGGRVKDRDRSWLDKMALYQIRRMYLEVGASMPLNGGFFSNIFQILQSPAASIDTFEKVSKLVQFWNVFDEVQTGRYEGWSEWERDVIKLTPLEQLIKAYKFDDSMFSMFEKEN